MKLLKQSGGIPLINYLVLAAAVVGATAASIDAFQGSLKTDLDGLVAAYTDGATNGGSDISALDTTPDASA